jgi:hypothetical protein
LTPTNRPDTQTTIRRQRTTSPTNDLQATQRKKRWPATHALNHNTILSQLSIFGGTKENIVSAFSLLSEPDNADQNDPSFHEISLSLNCIEELDKRL